MKTALLFPGYGSQSPGIGKELYDEYRVVQEYIEEATHCLSINVGQLCFSSSHVEINKIQNAYLVLFIVNVAIARLVQSLGFSVDMVCGYDQGGWAALCFADGINFPDGIYIVNKIGERYQQLLDSQKFMFVEIINCDTKTLEDICYEVTRDQSVALITHYVSKNVHIVAGYEGAVALVCSKLSKKVRVRETVSGGGLHSFLMGEVVDSLQHALLKVDIHKLKLPFLAPLTCRLSKSIAVVEQLHQLIEKPFNWVKMLEALAIYDTILIMGQSEFLLHMIMERFPSKKVLSIATKKDIEIMQQHYIFTNDQKGIDNDHG